MAGEFTIDTKALARALMKSVKATDIGLQNGLNDVKNDWITESQQIAPLQDGHLREAIDGEIQMLSDGGMVEVGVTASDLRHTSGKTFNYAAYIHDYDGKAVTGEKKFLDVPAQQSKNEWAKMLERALESELKKAGWR